MMHHSDTSLNDIKVGFLWRDNIDQLIKSENHPDFFKQELFFRFEPSEERVLKCYDSE